MPWQRTELQSKCNSKPVSPAGVDQTSMMISAYTYPIPPASPKVFKHLKKVEVRPYELGGYSVYATNMAGYKPGRIVLQGGHDDSSTT